MLSLLQTALELGLICSLTTLALFVSYGMLNVCDLSTDGCFTLGAAVGAVVAAAGHPVLSLPAAILAGMCSGFVTAFLQTRMGVNSLLAGIAVNTGLYSINIAVMGGSSLVNLNKVETVFTGMRSLLLPLHLDGQYKLITALVFVLIIWGFLVVFLKTRLGLSIRATGSNADMVRSSSIDPTFTTTVTLIISGGITALSGCLLAQCQKSANIDMGSGMVTIALASLLMGGTLIKRGSLQKRALGAVLGAVLFRLIYMIALRLHLPAFLLKLISALIVIVCIWGAQLQLSGRRKGGQTC